MLMGVSVGVGDGDDWTEIEDNDEDDEDVEVSEGRSEGAIIPAGRVDPSTVAVGSMLEDDVDAFFNVCHVNFSVVILSFLLFAVVLLLSLFCPVVIRDDTCAVITIGQRRGCGM